MKIVPNNIYQGDCIELMKLLPDESIDVILTDPPYLYLKNQKLDRPFDEAEYFNQAKRIFKKDGFVILFGRGTSFYRWNTMLADLGFTFKEEVVWDKSYCSSPLMAMSRVHETISIHTKGKGTINKVKVPYLEMKKNNISSICQDIKRMRSIFKNTTSLNAVLEFLENNCKRNDFENMPSMADKSNFHGKCNEGDRCVTVINSISNGMNERSIVRTDRIDCETFTKFGVNADKRKTGDRCANAMQSIVYGLNEKSIIKEGRDHYTAIHPTQKPPRLLERLLALVCKEGDLILDTFAGSCNLAKACINTNRHYICMEIDEEYYNAGVENVKGYKAQLQPDLFTAPI